MTDLEHRERVVAEKLPNGYTLLPDRQNGTYSILDPHGNTVCSGLDIDAAEEAAVDLRKNYRDEQ